MKYYQAVYQTDAHGFHVVYSKNIWSKEEEAREYDEHYNYEEQEYKECKVMWEYGLEGLEELAVREKI